MTYLYSFHMGTISWCLHFTLVNSTKLLVKLQRSFLCSFPHVAFCCVKLSLVRVTRIIKDTRIFKSTLVDDMLVKFVVLVVLEVTPKL